MDRGGSERRALIAGLVSALLLGAVTVAGAGPSADEVLRAAREERARRARLERRAAVLDDRRLQERVAGVGLGTVGLEPPSREATTGGPDAVATAPAEPSWSPGTSGPSVGEVVKDQRWWRDRLDRAGRRIGDLGHDLDWARTRLLLLRLGLVVPNDGLREFNRKIEIDGLFAEQARLETALAEARTEPDRIREEARREGVLPAWLR